MSEHYEVMGSFPELKQLPTQEQIDALKTQVNYLRKSLLIISIPTGVDDYTKAHTIAINALAATSGQCLAEVKAKAKPEPVKPDVYSSDGGEYWVQHPADCDIFSNWDDEPKVGDEYELQVCWTGKQKFRIAEVEDGSVEKVELIDSNTTYYTTPPAREPLSVDIAWSIWESLPPDTMLAMIARFTKKVEQAHGIGGES